MSISASLQAKILNNIAQTKQAAETNASEIFSLQIGKDLHSYNGKKLEMIDIENITPNPRNARIEFNQDELDTLANSIESAGLLNPITVRKVGLNQFQIVAGERRYRACKQLGKTSVECIVVQLTDEEMDFLMLTENLVREKISTYEVAKGVIEFEQNYPSKKGFAELLGISRQRLYRLLSFKKLPKSVLDRLGKKPSLLPDYAADQIATLTNKGYAIEQIEPIIHEAMDLVEEGKLEPTNIGKHIKIKLEKPTEKTPAVTTKNELLREDGLKVGIIKQSPKNFTVQLDNNLLDDDKRKAIEDFVMNMLKG